MPTTAVPRVPRGGGLGPGVCVTAVLGACSGEPRGGARCLDFEDLCSHKAKFFCLGSGCAARAAPYPGVLWPLFSCCREALAGPG